MITKIVKILIATVTMTIIVARLITKAKVVASLIATV